MKVLVADDHDMIREMIASFLETQDGASVALAGTLDEALERIAAEGPFDVVLLDYEMPGMNGLSGLAKALEATRKAPVALMSGIATRAIAEEALAAGAAGFLPKTLGAKSVVNALRFMAAGEIYAPVKWMTESAVADEHPIKQKLTERELQVLGHLCEGLSNKEIALQLGLQEVTVKLHVRTLCRKLDARNRIHAAVIGKEEGLF